VFTSEPYRPDATGNRFVGSLLSPVDFHRAATDPDRQLPDEQLGQVVAYIVDHALWIALRSMQSRCRDQVYAALRRYVRQ
jgi:hypothetical protein